MKLLITLLLLVFTILAKAQSPTPAMLVSDKIAGKMKDTLGLTETQRGQLYEINMQLHEGKMAKRQQYAGSDSLRLQVQWVENTRDSLYRPLLSEEQYLLYLQKKRNLINNN